MHIICHSQNTLSKKLNIELYNKMMHCDDPIYLQYTIHCITIVGGWIQGGWLVGR